MMILLFLLSRFWEFLKQIFSTNLAWSEKLPSVSLVCLVSFFIYCFPPRKWWAYRSDLCLERRFKSHRVNRASLHLCLSLTSHPGHTFQQHGRNRNLLHFKQIFTKETNPILKLLGILDQHIGFDEMLDFYHRYIHVLNGFVKHVDGFVLYYSQYIFPIGFNFLESLPLQLC